MDKSLLGELSLGQQSPWTIVSWTIVETPAGTGEKYPHIMPRVVDYPEYLTSSGERGCQNSFGGNIAEEGLAALNII